MAKMVLILKKSGGVEIKNNLIRLTEESYSVGRFPESDICLNDLFISRQHALLSSDKGQWFIQDLGSKNGTFLNGKRISNEPVRIAKGDIINFGDKVEFVFEHEIANYLSTQANSSPKSPYGIEINEKTQDIYIDGIRIVPRFSPKEYKMLTFMMKDPGRIYKYDDLYSIVFEERPQKNSDFYDPEDVQKSLYDIANSIRKRLKKQNITRIVLKARNNIGYQLQPISD